ncbi:uncharacterized protein LOC124197454 [Daphnia pulex]|uniref:uncharacterized protein LOC124197454 n=1 Tax=Daphnia pulex TaxID=6669 RepID=UPI001EDE7EA9|nr:uncharacterized protein LOC124197454 [Daphnia pulex]
MKAIKSSSLIVFITLSFGFMFTEVFCGPHHYRTRYQYCASTQTFFYGQCRPIGSTEHCPVNMQLFDGPNNQGFCHCDNYSYPVFDSETAYCLRLDNEGSIGLPVYSSAPSSIQYQAPCRSGTARDRSGVCSRPTIG